MHVTSSFRTLPVAGLWLSIGLVLITYICKGGNWDDNLVNLGWKIGMIILEIGMESGKLAW